MIEPAFGADFLVLLLDWKLELKYIKVHISICQ